MATTEIKTQLQNGILIVEISGAIDEKFSTFVATIPEANEMRINLKSLKIINSTGIREWIKFMQKRAKSKIYFIECPKIFIDQVNMVQGFVTSTDNILSFYVPYYNEDTDVEKSVLFTKGKEYDKKKLNLPAVKDDSGQIMEIDVVEGKYFKFIMS